MRRIVWMQVYFDNIWAFLMRSPLSTAVPVLFLNQPIITQRRVRVVLRLHKINYRVHTATQKSWNLKFAPQAWKSHLMAIRIIRRSWNFRFFLQIVFSRWLKSKDI